MRHPSPTRGFIPHKWSDAWLVPSEGTVQVGLICLISVRPYYSNTQSEISAAWYKTNYLGSATPSFSNIIRNMPLKVNKAEEKMGSLLF